MTARRAPIESLGKIHATDARRFEEWFLAGFFNNPEQAIAVADELGLAGEDFAYPEHCWLFRSLAIAADLGLQFTEQGIHRLNRLCNFVFPARYDEHCLREVLYSEVVSTGLRVWGEAVVELARRRARIQDVRGKVEAMLTMPATERAV